MTMTLKGIHTVIGFQIKKRSELIGGIREGLRGKNRHSFFKKAEKGFGKVEWGGSSRFISKRVTNSVGPQVLPPKECFKILIL